MKFDEKVKRDYEFKSLDKKEIIIEDEVSIKML